MISHNHCQLNLQQSRSWSVADVCAPGHAVHRLAGTYELAEQAGIAAESRFEIWLEGPSSERPDTGRFFEDPTSATNAIKTKIRAFGPKGRKLSDFLNRLVVVCNQPSRQIID